VSLTSLPARFRLRPGREAESVVPGITTVAVKRAFGYRAAEGLHSAESCARIGSDPGVPGPRTIVGAGFIQLAKARNTCPRPHPGAAHVSSMPGSSWWVLTASRFQTLMVAMAISSTTTSRSVNRSNVSRPDQPRNPGPRGSPAHPTRQSGHSRPCPGQKLTINTSDPERGPRRAYSPIWVREPLVTQQEVSVAVAHDTGRFVAGGTVDGRAAQR